METGFRLQPVSFSDLPGWQADNPRELIDALRRCRIHVLAEKHYKTGSLGVSTEDLLPAMNAAETHESGDAAAARQFFEAHFTPFKINKSDGTRGLVTAFYEPDVEVRAEPDDEWKHPFYRRPDDLIDLDDSNRPLEMDATYAFGLLKNGQISPYPDRQAIDNGYLEGRGLEIAWARSKEDVFFAHIQGAARLVYPDGNVKRITYAAKAGHAFSAIGKKLVDEGEIKPEDISMGSIRQWLRSNPERADQLYWHNRSYIFFRDVPAGDPHLGPIAAAKVQMTAGRSLAVDRTIHTFATPFFIASDSLTRLDQGQPFRRLMLALDTGSAIVGPARGDIFTGSGALAGDLAGAVKNEADFYVFLPSSAAARY
ncbi:murein transglycosylase A [Rhizobium sp. L1K21]|uniref:murein transglycosylase A n=1 Tax=Rhizobium sp. L1K21 TaxID=2954933 RepID=UPI002093C8CC|nr:murein transglycosylase A [Rhizobium sp. L1K21]MCO6187997.1 murein transglycosylase A [Rhizobium sp. L1K21]